MWARLRGGDTKVVLALRDSVTGVSWPPVVVVDEERDTSWASLFARAERAGLERDALCGVISDGTRGLAVYLSRSLEWVNHQRCVFHLWRLVRGELARQASVAAAGLVGDAATAVRRQVRKELVGLVHGVLDARSMGEAQVALAALAAHGLGRGLARVLEAQVEAALVHLKAYNQGVGRVVPEWCWRDFRLRLSRGRNHGSDERLERAALLWAIYHNFEPAQGRCERKRRYRYPGQCPLAVAGVLPGEVSYLDALGI